MGWPARPAPGQAPAAPLSVAIAGPGCFRTNERALELVADLSGLHGVTLCPSWKGPFSAALPGLHQETEARGVICLAWVGCRWRS